MLPRHSVCAAADTVRVVNDLRPPSHETFCLHPEAVLRPLAVKDENRVTSSADSFALGAMLFFESVDGNDVPGPIQGQIANPVNVRRVSFEAIREMDHRLNSRGKCRQLPDAMGKMP